MKLFLLFTLAFSSKNSYKMLNLKSMLGAGITIAHFPSIYVPMWFNLSFNLTPMKWIMVLMTLIIVLVSCTIPTSTSTILHEYSNIFCSIIMVISLMYFMSDNIVKFYVFFEASLIPISFMIMNLGYQPERLNATYSMFFYTITASMPLFLILANVYSNSLMTSFYLMGLTFVPSFARVLMALSATLAFLVKIPLYGLHLWLPKAHVEASVVGSIFLAAVLLKLGGYGILMISQMFNSDKIISILSLFSAWGGVSAAIICLRQTDLKVLIAYSSVSHMSLMTSSLVVNSLWGVFSGMFTMIAHSFSSCWMFFFSYFYYRRTNSRNLMISTGMASSLWGTFAFWFLACSANMGVPPMINLWAEIFSVVLLVNFSFWFLFPIVFILFFSVGYTLILFSSVSHGKSKFLTKQLNLPPQMSEYLVSFFLMMILIYGVFFLKTMM